jgi:hypothetical protein
LTKGSSLDPADGILAPVVVLIATCDPKAVFLWGDEVERYKALQDRRKLLWGLIIGILFVGLLSKFFV